MVNTTALFVCLHHGNRFHVYEIHCYVALFMHTFRVLPVINNDVMSLITCVQMQ